MARSNGPLNNSRKELLSFQHNSRLRLDALERLANIHPLELCHEAKVEKCRSPKDLQCCGKVVQHVLTSCGHASLCAECCSRYDACPICSVPIPKSECNLRLRLYDACLEAGLIRIEKNIFQSEHLQSWTEDVQRLYSLFDAAMGNNLISLVCHYVKDVCMDETAVSCDPVVAMLLDGGVVKDWCKITLLDITRHLQKIYTLEYNQMRSHSNTFCTLTMQLDAVLNVVEVLEESLSDSMLPQLIELQHLFKASAKVKQHLEVMEWCTKYNFLEDSCSRRVNINHWRNRFCERKAAAIKRAWPDHCSRISDGASQSEATLFIEDALTNIHSEEDLGKLADDAYGISQLRQQATVPYRDNKFSYLPESVRQTIDLLFLEGSPDHIIAKRAIFLYYLFDRHWGDSETQWQHIVEDYAGTFGITKKMVLESLVFFLLDENSEEALKEACLYLPEIVSPNMHPKVAQVLLERQNPDAALMVLRGSGHDCYREESACSTQGNSSVVALADAVTAVRVRLECGLLTDAYLYQRTHCLQIREWQLKLEKNDAGACESREFTKSRNWLSEMEILVSELCWLCMRRKILDKMIELPWHIDEEKFLRKSILEKAQRDPSSLCGNFLVVFYIQRCRYAEAYQVHEDLCNMEKDYLVDITDHRRIQIIQEAGAWRKQIVDKSMSLLPETEQSQLRSGNYVDSLFLSTAGKRCTSNDMDIEKPITAAVHEYSTVESSSPSPDRQNIDTVPYSSKLNNKFLVVPIKEFSNNEHRLTVDGRPHKTSEGNSLLFPKLHPSLASNALDYQSDKQIFGSDKMQEEYNVEKSDFIKSGLKPLHSELPGRKTRNADFLTSKGGSKNGKQNEHSVVIPSYRLDRDKMVYPNGTGLSLDSALPSSFDFASSSTSREESVITSQAPFAKVTTPGASLGSNGKRPPSDRSWLSLTSDVGMSRRRGTTSNIFFAERNHDFQSGSPQTGDPQRISSQALGVGSASENGNLRWRSDDGDEDEPGTVKISGRIRIPSTIRGRGIGRSRFYSSAIS